MKKKISLPLLVLSALLVLECTSGWSQGLKEIKKSYASPKPITNSVIWANLTKEKVYNNCITALHLQSFEIEPQMTSKESGLIVTRPVEFYPPFWRNKISGGEYYLNILVYEADTASISINIQIKGTKIYDYKVDASGEAKRIEVQKGEKKHYGTFTQSEVWNGLTIKISDDIEQFVTKLESILGKAVTKSTVTLSWE
jgi:hypothetical protein